MTTLGGVGPATAERLHQVGVKTVGDLAAKSLADLVALAGRAHGAGLYALARAEDDRAVVPDREAKSVSHEETFERDLTDLAVLGREIDSMATRVGKRLRDSAFSGRTVTLKLRRYDFTTLTRSQTLPQPTDDARQIAAIARRLLADAGAEGGLRLLGVGVSGLSLYAQGDLFAEDDDGSPVGRHRGGRGRGGAARAAAARRTSAGGRGRTSGTRSWAPGGCGAGGWAG